MKHVEKGTSSGHLISEKSGVEMVRQMLSTPFLAQNEVKNIASVVGDVLFFASHPQGRRLCASLLPISKARVEVASQILYNSMYPKNLRDAVAKPLREVFDPENNHWYKRAIWANELAQLSPELMRGFERYDLEQEYAKKKTLNKQSAVFIEDFLTGAIDVSILRDRLRAFYQDHQSFPSSPLDIWIEHEVQMLQKLPITDLRLIARHPVGKQLLHAYEQFDRILQMPIRKRTA